MVCAARANPPMPENKSRCLTLAGLVGSHLACSSRTPCTPSSLLERCRRLCASSRIHRRCRGTHGATFCCGIFSFFSYVKYPHLPRMAEHIVEGGASLLGNPVEYLRYFCECLHHVFRMVPPPAGSAPPSPQGSCSARTPAWPPSPHATCPIAS